MAIGLIVTLTIQDGKQAEFEAAMGELIAAVRANEPDTMLYALHRTKGSTTEYVMLEQYRTEEALDAHGKTAHFAAALPKLGPCLAGAPKQQRLDILI